VITFLDNYSSYCRVVFLHKKSDAAEAIKAVFWLWSNTTSHFVKYLHTDNREEYMTSELQSFLHEQRIVYKTSTPHVYQQNGQAKWLNWTLLEKVLKRLFTLGVFLFSFLNKSFLNYCLSSGKDKSLNKDKICDLLRKAP